MPTEPLVSICCLTYNHAPFIRDCIEGFLLQRVIFPIEILIHDDASDDGTDEIVKEYAEKYPDIIFPLFEKENQYTRGHVGTMDLEYNYSRARGKYIAYCEGDDYWTDPDKLQRQVDFLEAYPAYSVCFHRCQHLNWATGKKTKDFCGRYLKKGEEGVDISMDMFFGPWITQPLTMVFRRSSFSADWQKQYKYYRDMHEIYHLLKVGKGYLFSFVGGVYRYHSGGVASQISQEEYCRVSLPIDKEFYHKTKEPQARRNYLETLESCVNTYSGHQKGKALRYAMEHFVVSQKSKILVKNIIRIVHG